MKPVIKPPPLSTAVEGGLTLDDFTIDLDAGTITCPEEITVKISPTGTARFGSNCVDCPVRDRCTKARNGRTIKINPNHALLAAARVQAGTDNFQAIYRQYRPMIERTIAWLVRDNWRRLRYRGIARNQLAWSTRCAAINLKRLLALDLNHNDTWTINPAS